MDPILESDEILWKRRFKIHGITDLQLAKAAPWLATFIGDPNGEQFIYHWDMRTNKMLPMTRPNETSYFLLSPDGMFIYYLKPFQGEFPGHYVRVSASDGRTEDLTPQLPPYRSFSIGANRSGNRLSFTVPDENGFHTYVLDIDPNSRISRLRLLYESKSMTGGANLSANGEIGYLMTNKFTGTPHFGWTAIDTRTGRGIAELWDGPGINHNMGSTGIIPSPIPGDQRALGVTDRTGFERPLLWDPATGQRVDFDLPEIEGDLRPTDWSADGKRFLLQGNARARQSIYQYDLEKHALIKLSRDEGTFSSPQFGADNRVVAVWEDACHPARIVALDADSMKWNCLLSIGKNLPGRPWQRIEFKTVNGNDIDGWLAQPAGTGPFPTTINPGTLWGKAVEHYNPESQAWMDHGYAFLYLNRRGSQSMRDYDARILDKPGYWELKDLQSTHVWLVNHGISDPKRIFLTGESHGGYLTLLALGQQPDLWAGGIARMPVIDWKMVYEDAEPESRKMVVDLLKGTPEENPAAYLECSPMTYAESIRSPVLIIAGKYDTHATTRQVTAFQEKLKCMGKVVEVAWYEGGHGWPNSEEIHFQELMLDFTHRIIK